MPYSTAKAFTCSPADARLLISYVDLGIQLFEAVAPPVPIQHVGHVVGLGCRPSGGAH